MEHADHAGGTLVRRAGEAERRCRSRSVVLPTTTAAGCAAWCRRRRRGSRRGRCRVARSPQRHSRRRSARRRAVRCRRVRRGRGRRSGADDTEEVGRPHDVPLAINVLDRRAGDGEVVERIRVDLADDDAVRPAGDEAQCRRRHAGGVEPSTEGDEQNRIVERRQVVDGEDESVTSRARSAATERQRGSAYAGERA